MTLKIQTLHLLKGAACVSLLGTLTVAHAGSPCDMVTQGEASRLLGVTAVKKLAQPSVTGSPGCLIQSGEGGDDSLRVSVETIALEDAPRLLQHIDEERGDERPSMHGDSWYEISIADPEHPAYRRMVVHRDRFSLVLDLQSTHQKNAKAALEKVWFKLSERLPNEQKD